MQLENRVLEDLVGGYFLLYFIYIIVFGVAVVAILSFLADI